jgi:hypothetical protein
MARKRTRRKPKPHGTISVDEPSPAPKSPVRGALAYLRQRLRACDTATLSDIENVQKFARRMMTSKTASDRDRRAAANLLHEVVKTLDSVAVDMDRIEEREGPYGGLQSAAAAQPGATAAESNPDTAPVFRVNINILPATPPHPADLRRRE